MDKVNFMNFVEVLAARAPQPGEEDKPGPRRVDLLPQMP